MVFQPGQSGNPKGRPRVGESLASAIRERFPVERVVELAEELITKEGVDDRVRLNTLQFIAERGYGKVAQAIEGSAIIEPGHMAFLAALRMTPEERRKRLEEVAAEDDAALAEADDGSADT